MASKVDLAAMRGKIYAEYADLPNPDGDSLIEMERRAAGVIADLCVFMISETQRDPVGADVGELSRCLAGIVSTPLVNLIIVAGEKDRRAAELIVGTFMESMMEFLDPRRQPEIPDGEIVVVRKEVPDA